MGPDRQDHRLLELDPGIEFGLVIREEDFDIDPVRVTVSDTDGLDPGVLSTDPSIQLLERELQPDRVAFERVDGLDGFGMNQTIGSEI